MEHKVEYVSPWGVRRTIVTDDSNKFAFAQYSEQDVTSVIDKNAALREALKPRSVNKLVARAPITVYEQSIRENWDENDWKKWLNDPANKPFRVWEGNV